MVGGEMMKIKQILNNNALLVKKGKNELIVLANGIGFKRKIGEKINEAEVDKIFVLDTHEMVEHFSYLLGTIPAEHIYMISEIVEYATQTYQMVINDYIYLTLIDHIEFALKRSQEGNFLKSPLAWEIKKFYKKEYDIGLHAVKIIQSNTGISLNEEEAVSIALHFVNIQTNQQDMDITLAITKIVQDILNIVTYQYKIILDENSVNYARFITHLQYFAQRVVSQDTYEQQLTNEQQDNELYMQVKTLYKEAFACVQKIRLYIYNKHHVLMSKDEDIYLTLHIRRVTQRQTIGGKKHE